MTCTRSSFLWCWLEGRSLEHLREFAEVIHSSIRTIGFRITSISHPNRSKSCLLRRQNIVFRIVAHINRFFWSNTKLTYAALKNNRIRLLNTLFF